MPTTTSYGTRWEKNIRCAEAECAIETIKHTNRFTSLYRLYECKQKDAQHNHNQNHLDISS